MDISSAVKSAPDGGYGWCVCASAFSVHFVLAGIQNSFGILYVYILDEFGGKKGTSGTRINDLAQQEHIRAVSTRKINRG